MSKTPIIVAAVILAEVLALTAIAFAAKDVPAGGIAVRAGEASVSAKDQSVWDSVTLDRVSIPVDGWVVVRAVDGDSGAPAAVLGYAAVAEGTNVSVVVPVDRTDGLPAAVVVLLAADKGEAGVFEFDAGSGGGMGGGMSAGGASNGSDKPLLADGSPVQASVRITPYGIGNLGDAATLGTAVLSSAGNSVTISGVSAPGPSWLVVTVSGVSESGAGETLGVRAIPTSESREYTIDLTSPAGAQQLRVSLHADLGARGVLEFDPGDVMNSPDQMYYTEASYLAVTVSKP